MISHEAPKDYGFAAADREFGPLMKAFDEEGIEIPLPHRVLVSRSAKATDVGERKRVVAAS